MKRRLLCNPVGLLSCLLTALFFSMGLVGTPSANAATDSGLRAACENVQVAAHRGFGPGTRWVGRVQYTEDTIKSATGAFHYGADVVKADLHMSAEGTWFILHDEDLARVTGGRNRRLLRSMTDEQVRAVVLPDGSHIPSLDDYLKNLRNGTFSSRMVQLEVKRQAHTRVDLQRAVDQIRSYGLQDQVLLLSSTKAMVKEMWSIAPEISRTYVWYPNGSQPAFSQVSPHAQMINIDQSQATVRWVRAAHRYGFKVAVRSANTSRQWYKLLHRAANARPDQVSTDNIPSYSRWCSSR